MTLHGLFREILNMSLTALIVIVTVLLARLLLRRAPKVFSYALWAVVLFRLLCPVSIEMPFGMRRVEMPAARVSEMGGATDMTEQWEEDDIQAVQIPSQVPSDVDVQVRYSFDR